MNANKQDLGQCRTAGCCQRAGRFYTETWEAYHQIDIIIPIEFQVAQGGAILHPRRYNAQRLKVLWVDTYKREDIRVFQVLPNQSLSTEFLW